MIHLTARSATNGAKWWTYPTGWAAVTEFPSKRTKPTQLGRPSPATIPATDRKTHVCENYFWQINRESFWIFANPHFGAEIANLVDASSGNCIQCQKMISHTNPPPSPHAALIPKKSGISTPISPSQATIDPSPSRPISGFTARTGPPPLPPLPKTYCNHRDGTYNVHMELQTIVFGPRPANADAAVKSPARPR